MKNSFKGKEIEKKQKYFLSLDRELDSLQKERKNLPSIELPKPVFAYYEIGWELNEKGSASKYGDSYKKIIDEFSPKEKASSIKKAKSMNPPAFKLSKRMYADCVKEIPDCVRWFDKVKVKEKYTGEWTFHYFWKKTDLLRKKIVKVYWTHYKEIDPRIERRIAEIDSTIFDNVENNRLYWKYCGYRQRYERDELIAKINKSDNQYYSALIKEALNDTKED